MPINFISVSNNFTNNQTIHYSDAQKRGNGSLREKKTPGNYIMKFSSKNDNEFYISSNLSTAPNPRQKEKKAGRLCQGPEPRTDQHHFGQKANARLGTQKAPVQQKRAQKAELEKR